MGLIFDIQRFSLNDGPGIRTTVFLKGCPLRCEWCHNPESWKPVPELSYNSSKCVNCQACSICDNNAQLFTDNGHVIDRVKCSACGKCVKFCSNGALRIIGYEMEANQVIDIVLKDRRYYETSKHNAGSSPGGMTLSGGEPLFQPDFTVELLRLAKDQGIHTAVETSGYGAKRDLERIIPYTDLFLFDFKADKNNHRLLTGVEQSLILENLYRLAANHVDMIIRCPIIPGKNGTPEFYSELDDVLSHINKTYQINIESEFLPFHNFGERKLSMLN